MQSLISFVTNNSFVVIGQLHGWIWASGVNIFPVSSGDEALQ